MPTSLSRRELLWGAAAASLTRAQPAAAAPATPRLKLIMLSDTHVGHAGDAERLEQLLPYLACERADLIVHGGDLVDSGLSAPAQLDLAKRLVGKLPAPVVLVPGNHDIGMRCERGGLSRWRQTFGATEQSVRRGGFRVVGFNSMALTQARASKRDEDEVLAFLDAQVPERPGEPVLVLHHLPPVMVPKPGLPQVPWSDRALATYDRMLERLSPAAVLAGHWHLGVRVPRLAGPLTVAPAVSGLLRLPTGYLRGIFEHGRLRLERVMVDVRGKRELPWVVRLIELPEGRSPLSKHC